MTERFDHRDAAAREADAAEDQTIDAPIESGAQELREKTQHDDERGEAADDPATSD